MKNVTRSPSLLTEVKMAPRRTETVSCASLPDSAIVNCDFYSLCIYILQLSTTQKEDYCARLKGEDEERIRKLEEALEGFAPCSRRDAKKEIAEWKVCMLQSTGFEDS